MKLIVGLGNSNAEYERTRHNAGFMAVRWLAHSWQLESRWTQQNKLEAFVLRDIERDIILAQPTTMMNDSGRAVRKLMDYYKLTPQDVTIIHDDADLEVGVIRRVDSTQSGAGHHGVLSVLEHIGPQFKRIRIGIGRPEQPIRDISDYVLGRMTNEERQAIEAALTAVTVD